MDIKILDVGVFDTPKILASQCFEDERGVFSEVWNRDLIYELMFFGGIQQVNESVSKKNVFRGMHFQWNPPMGKLVRCVEGAVIDVLVDMRYGSNTFGKSELITLDLPLKSVWIPPGFAHGFYTIKNDSVVQYACSAKYNQDGEGCFNPVYVYSYLEKLGVTIEDMILSEKDRCAITLNEFNLHPIASKLFPYKQWS